MRNRTLIAAGMLLAIVCIPVQGVLGEVYEAPYYQEQGPEISQATYGYPGMMAPQGCGMNPCACGSCDSGCGSPATKLGRGVTNFLTGWLEFPKHTLIGAFSCNVTPLEGGTVGAFRGFGRAVERTGVGFFEMVTFPIPGFDPLLCPEYLSLEGNCMNFRNDCYCGGYCPLAPCNPCCPPPCPPPCPPRPMDGGWGQALQKPLNNSTAMGPAPSQAPPIGQVRERAPGPVTYPDDYLK